MNNCMIETGLDIRNYLSGEGRDGLNCDRVTMWFWRAKNNNANQTLIVVWGRKMKPRRDG
ncbi:9828_t:CDS:2 [Dentiscutata erythropus]|uniref:9828_t:CDS:1 n=1 Tax=Dentiscutata erythropus TaxID=1348616 RepID=A0A9N8W449_9GLOM|nr:9828_t:CDS:2 [Dentiscutata erythropus]